MTPVRALLCDADGCLFPSEAPAFEASVEVTNALMRRIGCVRRFTAEELMENTLGRNFRTTAGDLIRAAGAGISDGELERWVRREAQAVTAHLGAVLSPDDSVIRALNAVPRDITLALVSSSASARLDACLSATELSRFFPEAVRFSAEDSLSRPIGKPDPAIYRHAASELGSGAEECLAIEDSVAGVQSASAAGIPVIGMIVWVPRAEQRERAHQLLAAGARSVVDSWDELEGALDRGRESHLEPVG